MPARRAVERGDLPKADGAEKGAGLSGREARCGRGRNVESQVEADTAARGAAALRAQTDLIRAVEEGEIVGTQPVVSKDQVRVSVHIQLHKRFLLRLVEAAEHQLHCHSAAACALQAVSLQH